jgi:hypothetical protein
MVGWMNKYANELRYQDFRVLDWHDMFLQIPIKHLELLILANYPAGTITLSPSIDHLSLVPRFDNEHPVIPSVKELTSLSIGIYSNTPRINYEGVPTSLQILALVSHFVDIDHLPTLPCLESLDILRCCSLKNIASLKTKFKSIARLGLKNHVSAEACPIRYLRGLEVNELVIECEELVDISWLQHVHVSVLDLSMCPKVADFSPVAHIPKVIKFA